MTVNNPTVQDEIWTMRDGTKIAVGDMDEDHVRNTLRMIMRQRRLKREAKLASILDETMTIGDAQEMLNSQYWSDLANPNCFFPLLDGGVCGSPELQRKYGK